MRRIGMRAISVVGVSALALTAGALAASGARASGLPTFTSIDPQPPAVSLTAGFAPDRLNAGTTIHFGFHITTPAGEVPEPLLSVQLFYPANFGLESSGLGLTSCRVAALEADGPSGCPQNSRMGFGTGTVEVPLGPEIVVEKARIVVFSRPVQDERLSVIFYAIGEGAIAAQLAFSSLVQPAPAPFGGELETKLPTIPSVPEGPNASVTSLDSTIGPSHITYHRHVHGRTIAYRPRGFLMPPSCPRGGFPFSATFSFAGGQRAQASAHVPCPPPAHAHRSARHGHR